MRLGIRSAYGISAITLAMSLVVPATASAGTINVRVTVQNLAPGGGTLLTPLWAGFHNGGFDVYDSGEPASAFLERLAEDGNTGPISDAFTAIAGGNQGTLSGALTPGASGSITLAVDDANRFFSYAAMVIPSNDAFIANGSPTAFEIIDQAGNFIGANFFVTGADVLDAGTEVNDELPANTAAFGQAAPNTGVDEFGLVRGHGGFLPVGSGGILDDPAFANADFTAKGFPIAHITVAPVPIPGALVLMVSSLLGLGLFRRRGSATA